MSGVLRRARVLADVWFAHMSVYRAEIIVWVLTGATPLIMLAIWIAMARGSGGTINEFSPPEFAAYFLAAWLTQQAIVAWVSWEVDRQIRRGELSPKLLRPMDPMWEHVAAHITERVVRLPFVLLIMIAGAWLVPGTRITPGIGYVAAYLVCVTLAFALRFLMAYCIGLLAFWLDQATAFDEVYHLLAAFLTGGFAPLTFYPPAIQAIIEWTPFPYFVYYPVRVLTGAADMREMIRVIAVQLAWLLVLVVLRRLLWRRGLRRYGAVGA